MKYLIAVTLMFFISVSVAETKYGAGISYGSYSVDDPDGTSARNSELALSGIMTMPINRNYAAWRYWFEIVHNEFTLEPSKTNVGQTVNSTTFEAIAQFGFNVSPYYRPWVGMGIGVGLNDYSDRITVTSDGFADRVLENRSGTSLFIIFNSGISLRKTKAGLIYGTAFNHKLALDNGIQASTLDLFFLY